MGLAANFIPPPNTTFLKLQMATKKSKAAAPTDDELNKLLEGIGEEESTAPAPTSKASKPTKPAAQSQSEQDLLAELDNLENLGAQPPSRPHTPRIQSIKRTATGTPPPQSSRTSEEKAAGPRPSGDSTRSFHTSFTPSATSSDLQEAEKKAPIAQPAEEVPAATVGVLRGFGGELRSRALPTFTNILHTLAPPISSHERLQIHITHDFIGYPSLDPLIYSMPLRP